LSSVPPAETLEEQDDARVTMTAGYLAKARPARVAPARVASAGVPAPPEAKP